MWRRKKQSDKSDTCGKTFEEISREIEAALKVEEETKNQLQEKVREIEAKLVKQTKS